MNSGNTVPFAQKRGKASFMKMNDYPFEARRKRGAYWTVAEVAVNSDIPDVLDFVLSVNCMTSEGEVRRISYAAVQENSEPDSAS
jgi:predicted metal-dependent peptidase